MLIRARIYTILFLLSLALQLILIPLRTQQLFGDENEYWLLAQGALFNYLRPIGYPAFIAFLTHAGLSLTGIYIVQSCLVALRPLLVVAVLKQYGITQPAALLGAGILTACSFTGLTISKRILADSILALVFILCIYLLNHWQSRKGALAASGLISLALLLKPIAILWMGFLAMFVLAHTKCLRLTAKRLVLLASLPLIVWLGFAQINHKRYGVSTFSGISQVAFNRYLGAATLGLEETGGRWDDAIIHQKQDELTAGPVRQTFSEGMNAEAYKAIDQQNRTIYTGRLRFAVLAMAFAFIRNFPRPFYWYELGALNVGNLPLIGWLLCKALTWGVWFMAITGILLAIKNKRYRAPVIALTAIFLIYLTVCSISFWEGSRLAFPVEWILFFCCGIAIEFMVVARAARGGRRIVKPKISLSNLC